MITISTNPACCGVGDIYGLSQYSVGDMEKALEDLMSYAPFDWTGKQSLPDYQYPLQGFYVFTQGAAGSTPPYGDAFKEVIEKYNLGTVVRTEPNGNPRHDYRPVIMYVWTLNFDGMKKYWTEKIASQAKDAEIIRNNEEIERKRREEAVRTYIHNQQMLAKGGK